MLKTVSSREESPLTGSKGSFVFLLQHLEWSLHLAEQKSWDREFKYCQLSFLSNSHRFSCNPAFSLVVCSKDHFQKFYMIGIFLSNFHQCHWWADQWSSWHDCTKSLCSVNEPETAFVVHENIKYKESRGSGRCWTPNLTIYLLVWNLRPKVNGSSCSSFPSFSLPTVGMSLGAEVDSQEM